MHYAAGQHRLFDEGCGIVNTFSEYLISVTGAALVSCGILCLIDKSKQQSTIVRLICGVFVLITIIRPLLQLEVALPYDFADSLRSDTDAIIESGTNAVAVSNKLHINKQLESYIQQKLKTLNCDLKVVFALQDEYPYTPINVQLAGEVSPYTKSYLTNWIYEELGIKPEDQQWTS